MSEGKKELQPIVSKPLEGNGDYGWEYHMSYDVWMGECRCGFCGTLLPSKLVDPNTDDRDVEDEEQYHTVKLLGREVVLECCGDALLAHLYNVLGAAFCERHIVDSAKNPTGEEFRQIQMTLDSALTKAQEVLQKALKEVDKQRDSLAETQKGEGR